MSVAIMDVLNSPRMFDGAPVLLGTPCNFHDVGEQTVRIGAVHAIQTLEGVQVPQFVAVNRQVIPAPRFGYAVNGKAHGLIRGNEQIQQRERNNASVDKRRRENREESRMQDISHQRSLQSAVLPLDFLREPDLAVAQLVKLRLDL